VVEINQLTGQIVDSAMRVHSQLGPGLLESAYEACLAHELQKRGVRTFANCHSQWSTTASGSMQAIGLTSWSKMLSSWS